MVFIGSWLSGYFIIATDAWMQHPVGFERLPNGEYQLNSIRDLLLNPWVLWQYLHNMTASVVTASFVLGSIGAYYLLARKHQAYRREFVKLGALPGLVPPWVLA